MAKSNNSVKTEVVNAKKNFIKRNIRFPMEAYNTIFANDAYNAPVLTQIIVKRCCHAGALFLIADQPVSQWPDQILSYLTGCSVSVWGSCHLNADQDEPQDRAEPEHRTGCVAKCGNKCSKPTGSGGKSDGRDWSG